MGFTNSPLVNYTKISPNKTVNRNHAIDTITIHCAVGLSNSNSIARYLDVMTVDASANYCIGKDGGISCMIPEKYRSWCSSNTANDDRAITIEVASETSSPYKVPTDTALTLRGVDM